MTIPLHRNHVHRGDETPLAVSEEQADPITTQIIRNALTSAARQMAKTTVRTAFSPVVYESLDFAVVLYDAHFRLLGQGPTIPAFMGTMSFCITAAVDAAGGVERLSPGDVILYNIPYGTGSHAQDCAVVMPIFDDALKLIGFAANKAHWADIGAYAPYCTNTTEIYQEGTILPGVKLYDAGVLNEAILRIIHENSRFPKLVDGDLRAQIASCNVGSRELLRIVDRFGLDTFHAAVDRMIAHGEEVVRSFISSVPDGRYSAMCHLDSNGIEDTPIEFEVAVEIRGREIEIDFTGAPDAQPGPVNCPLPSTVSLARITLAMIAGDYEAPNEGHFRALNVRTRTGSMFHPQKPAPCFLYGWALMSAMEGLLHALANAVPGLPSGSAGDICSVGIYGRTAEGEDFYSGGGSPVGSGACPTGDGSTLFVPSLAQSRSQSTEVIEAKSPAIIERYEYVVDSAGPGQHRGGPGWQRHLRVLQDVRINSTIDRTKVPGWAQRGGLPGSANRAEIAYPDGKVVPLLKATAQSLPTGSVIRVFFGGGGGYGDPTDRDPAAVAEDVRNGLVSAAHVQNYYPQAAGFLSASGKA